MPKAGWRWLEKKREETHSKAVLHPFGRARICVFPWDMVRGSQALDILKGSGLRRVCASTFPKANSCAAKQSHHLDIYWQTEDVYYPRKCPKLWPEAAGVVGDKRTVKRAGMIDIWNISQFGVERQACWPIRKEAGQGGCRLAENISLQKSRSAHFSSSDLRSDLRLGNRQKALHWIW